MYSKKLLRLYIEQGLHLKGSNYRQLAIELGISHSNLSRALEESAANNLTLPQFAHLVKYLELDPSQVLHILTGKKAKEASTAAVLASAKHLVEQLSKGNGV